MWDTDWKFHHEGNCSASRSLPSDAEKLSRVTEFSIRTEQPLWISFFAYSSFAITFILENVLFYQIYAQIIHFSIKRCSVRFLRYWCQNVWRKMTSTWRQDVQNDVKIVIMTSMHESRLTPLLAPVGFTEIPIRYARILPLPSWAEHW